MSSPIAKERKSLFDRILIGYHKKVSHLNRINLLSDYFNQVIEELQAEKTTIRLLDIGCGDMAIAKAVASKNDKIEYTCIDIYPNTHNWEHYIEFDGKNFPLESNSFDIALFSDVLHHDYENISRLLDEAKRVSKSIIIKDHFEYGLWSRKMLQLADFIGNYGYGVSIPKKYFTKKAYASAVEYAELKEVHRICPVQLYENSKLAKYLLKSKYQFISVLNDRHA